MRPRRGGVRLLVAAAVCAIVAVGVVAPAATAQDGGGQEVPTRDIIPAPDSGEAPEEAGDRGGGLQLAVLGLVVAAIVGGAGYVTVQARRARGYSSTSARMASHADTPSMNPDR